MAASPQSGTLPTPKKKEESFLDKIGTLGRKKKAKEVNELQEEGKYAIESPTSPTLPDIGPEGYNLDENEERSMIQKSSRDDPKVIELTKMLLDWINDVLADDRIIVKDIEDDLFDGQILQKLIEKLAGHKIKVPEVTQSELAQKQKLQIVLSVINNILQLPPTWSQSKWSVDSIHSKNLVAILHLLVSLARHFRAPIRLPDNVSISLMVVQKRDGRLIHRQVAEEITTTNEDIGARFERDAFDTLFDHAPDKLNLVKKTLVTFVNKQLLKINLEVTDLDNQTLVKFVNAQLLKINLEVSDLDQQVGVLLLLQINVIFHDGVYLVLLMGLLEGYFVPLYDFHLTPDTFDQKVHNVSFAFELMQDAGLAKPKARPEDVVNQDLKSTLRVLYNIFTKYKEQAH